MDSCSPLRLALVALLMAFFSCSRVEEVRFEVRPVPMTIRAVGTRTSFDSTTGSVSWNAGDSICVFDGYGIRKFITAEGGVEAVFDGSAIPGETMYMLYPYSPYTSFENGSPAKLKCYVSGTQKASANSFDPACNMSASPISEGTFYARNLSGLLKFKISRSDVSSVRITSRDGSKMLSGYGKVSFDPDGIPSVSAVAGSASVAMVPAAGRTVIPKTDGQYIYYLACLPGEFADGFSVHITTEDGKISDYEIAGPLTVERAAVLNLGIIDNKSEFVASDGPRMIEFRRGMYNEDYNQRYGPQLTLTVGDLEGYCPSAEPELDEYGGWKGTFTFPATGWFRVERKGGRWWMVDPAGNPFINKGVCGFTISTGNYEATYETYYHSDKFGGSGVNNTQRRKNWAADQWGQLKSFGFNSLGTYCKASDVKALSYGVPYSIIFSVVTPFSNSLREKGEEPEEAWANQTDSKNMGPWGFPPVFHPDFEKSVEKTVAEYAATVPSGSSLAYCNDPWLMGVTTDNEHPIPINSLYYCMTKWGEGNCYHDAAAQWLKDNGVSYEEASVSLDWRKRFSAYCYERYLSVVSAAVKKYFPNHLYLGTKITGTAEALANDYAFVAGGKYCDVVSIDYYGVWAPDPAVIERWSDLAGGKPVIFGEFYVQGDDFAKGGNTSGAGWTVHTQAERGLFYQNYVINCTRSDRVVGWNWFRYMEYDKNSNKGIFDECFEPFTDLTSRMTEVNGQVYQLLMQ